MKLSNTAIDHRTTVMVLILVIVLFGAFSYATLPRESAPDIQIPFISVVTPYEGASPVDIENTVVITPLGISALSFPWTLEEEGQRLGYTQISRIVPALQGAGVLPLEPAVDLPGSE